MLTNPVIISVIVMSVLCLSKLHVLLSLLIAALVAGLTSGMGLTEIMSILVGGMSGNANTALSYILLGALAAAMEMTGAAEVLSIKISRLTKGNKFVLAGLIVLVSMASGTIVPVHIAFIPILIPPLLSAMNRMKMDRRMAAVAFGFGLKAPYITIPIAYGAIFHGIIRDSMAAAGLEVPLSLIWKTNWMAGLTMVVGLIIGLIVYSKPREYKMDEEEIIVEGSSGGTVTDVKLESAHIFSIIAGVAALVVQLITDSLPLGALIGLIIMIVSRSIKWNQIEEMLNGGVKMMGLIAFVMLVAAGYAEVINATGAVPSLVDAAMGALGGSKLAGATIMILLGLLITMGIGTSFGTVPVIAAIYVPLAQRLGFSPAAIVFMISVAAALGDAGSPASDTTLGPTSGLNADGQHDHIWDTCIPQFICYDIPLLIIGIVWPLILG